MNVPAQIATPSADLMVVLPELIVMVMGIVILITELFLKKEQRRPVLTGLALVGLGAALVSVFFYFGQNHFTFISPSNCDPAHQATCGLVVVDDLANFFKIIFLSSAILAVLLSATFIEEFGMPLGEYYCVMLMATAGMMVVASGTDLITIFVGIELSSLSTYILTGWARNDKRGNEAGLKYFLLGIFATSILVYGMTWTYGLTGSTNIFQIAAKMGDLIGVGGATANTLLTLAVLLLVAGLAFKIAAVPFHMWTPDAYQGAPTPMTAFMSVAPKAAAFAAMIRILVQGMGAAWQVWVPVIAVLSVLTMTLGNIVGVAQRNVKRMLAYSSIAHTGYILIGLAAFKPGTDTGAVSSVMFYSFAYAFMNMGAFGLIVWLQHQGLGEELDDFSGLSQWSPGMAVVMTFCLISLMGIPPTVGFFAKYYVFIAAIRADLTWLAVVGALNSAVAAFFYVRIIWYMYFRDPSHPRAIAATEARANNTASLLRPGAGLIVGSLVLSAVLTVVFFFLIGPVTNFTSNVFKAAADGVSQVVK